MTKSMRWRPSSKEGILSPYRDFLPLTSATPFITLGEGSTPLVRSERLGKKLGCGALYFKLEGCNPTGSFKDRGMVLAVAKALEAESSTIICASTGNTSASAAAYGARYGLRVIIIVPKGKIARGKFVQAVAYQARIITIDGNFDQALGIVRAMVQKYPFTLVNSLNPYRLEGQKTAAFEIVDILEEAPDYLFIPVGNAGNITAYWKGFVEYHQAKKAKSLPRMMGFEAEGAAPIVRGYPISEPKTVASAIRIGNPANWKGAVAARDASGGIIDCVNDEEILEAYSVLASAEGIFGEPASATSLAGLLKMVRGGKDFSGKSVVCIVTGSGLKDPDIMMKDREPFPDVPADLRAVEQALELG